MKRYFCSFIKRGNYKQINHTDIEFFNKILSTKHVLSKYNNPSLASDALDTFNIDFTHSYKGNSQTVLFPSSNEEVSEILNYCNLENIAVCPQSGNTGLVGGSNPIFDEVIIKMNRFNKIISFDKISNTLHCQSGVILNDLFTYLDKFKCIPSIDIASKGSCMIGGNISTNAGGIHFIKYGSMRKNVKGLKVVLPNGQIIDNMNPLPKNNTGYDLKQLFIGSEGTLGIITECLINCYRKATNKETYLFQFTSFDNIIKFFTNAKLYFEDSINAIELIDSQSMRLSVEKNNLIYPFHSNSGYFLLFEIVNNNDEDIKEQVEAFISNNESLINDCLIASDETQVAQFWKYREMILDGCLKAGPLLIYDISLDVRLFDNLINLIRQFCKDEDFSVTGFGHIGDYNLHINIVDEKEKTNERLHKFKAKVEKIMFDYLKSVNGSISAEHGIGLQKIKYLNITQSDQNILLMKNIKKAIDPKGIMNPYKIFI